MTTCFAQVDSCFMTLFSLQVCPLKELFPAKCIRDHHLTAPCAFIICNSGSSFSSSLSVCHLSVLFTDWPSWWTLWEVCAVSWKTGHLSQIVVITMALVYTQTHIKTWQLLTVAFDGSDGAWEETLESLKHFEGASDRTGRDTLADWESLSKGLIIWWH